MAVAVELDTIKRLVKVEVVITFCRRRRSLVEEFTSSRNAGCWPRSRMSRSEMITK